MSKLYIVGRHTWGEDGFTNILSPHAIKVQSIHRTVKAANLAALRFFDIDEEQEEDPESEERWVKYGPAGEIDIKRSYARDLSKGFTRLRVVERELRDLEYGEEDEFDNFEEYECYDDDVFVIKDEEVASSQPANESNAENSKKRNGQASDDDDGALSDQKRIKKE